MELHTSQMPSYTVGGLVYQGVWNANTNVPAIPVATGLNKGWYWKVSVSGTANIDGINEWKVGDWIVSNGASWDKIDNTDSVSSVAGRTGAIVLTKADIDGIDQVENTSDINKPVSTAQQNALNLKVDKVAGKGLSTEDFTTLEKSKLSNIASNAEVNQNAFSSIVVAGQNSVVAESKTDTLTLVAGTNIAIITDDTSDSITINCTSAGITNLDITTGASSLTITSDTGTDATINGASTTVAGLMVAVDKVKLNGIESGAQVNTVTSVNSKTGAVSLTKTDIGLGNVSNILPSDMPVSTAQQNALDLKASAQALSDLDTAIGSRATNYVLAFETALNA